MLGILTLVFFLMNCSKDNKKSIGDSGKILKVVVAKGGLRVRENPEGNVLGTIGEGESVEVLGETGKLLRVSGKSGRWTKIRFGSGEGWVFGGYLEEEASLSGKVSHPALADFPLGFIMLQKLFQDGGDYGFGIPEKCGHKTGRIRIFKESGKNKLEIFFPLREDIFPDSEGKILEMEGISRDSLPSVRPDGSNPARVYQFILKPAMEANDSAKEKKTAPMDMTLRAVEMGGGMYEIFLHYSEETISGVFLDTRKEKSFPRIPCKNP